MELHPNLPIDSSTVVTILGLVVVVIDSCQFRSSCEVVSAPALLLEFEEKFLELKSRLCA